MLGSLPPPLAEEAPDRAWIIGCGLVGREGKMGRRAGRGLIGTLAVVEGAGAAPVFFEDEVEGEVIGVTAAEDEADEDEEASTE